MMSESIHVKRVCLPDGFGLVEGAVFGLATRLSARWPALASSSGIPQLHPCSSLNGLVSEAVARMMRLLAEYPALRRQ
jgi:hypothetical protein